MKPLILFAPGAGAPSSHPWMQKWKVRLSDLGNVETFDYDYMRESRKRPDPLPKLIAAHRKALSQARERHAAGSTILIGQCTRDPLCPLDLLEQVRAEMKTSNFLHIVEGGDHSLRVPKRLLELKSETQEDVDRKILETIAGYVDQLP